MKTRAFLIALPFVGALLLVPGANWVRKANSVHICQSHLKRLVLGALQYQRDYDEKNMIAAKWSEVTMPYVKQEEVYDCPLEEIGYAYNRYLSGIPLSRVNAPASTPLIYDSTLTAPNASDYGRSWPAQGVHWKPREIGNKMGSNVVYFDGHVEWMQRKPLFVRHTVEIFDPADLKKPALRSQPALKRK